MLYPGTLLPNCKMPSTISPGQVERARSIGLSLGFASSRSPLMLVWTQTYRRAFSVNFAYGAGLTQFAIRVAKRGYPY